MDRRRFLRAGLMSAAGLAALSAGRFGAWARPLENDPDAALLDAQAGIVVNDVHGQINRTRVSVIRHPMDSLSVARFIQPGGGVAVCGGRHAMGGQQFATGKPLIDMRSMNRVIGVDRTARTVTAEAGITWPELVAWLNREAPELSIIQKQTGADDLTLGGALSANAHGRGLSLAPIISNVEKFTLRMADGTLRTCSRDENAELFSLVIGGYGLFGIIETATLRLMQRRKLRRDVEILTIDKLIDAVDRKVVQGYWYGDFQYKTDPAADDFMRTGVFSCYQPVDEDADITPAGQNLSLEDWQTLYELAHDNKKAAFEKYSAHYLSTNGNIYWSDSHQMSTYQKDQNLKYADKKGISSGSSLVISEIYFPREQLAQGMEECRTTALQQGMDIVYGTVRFIEQDTESFLPWARKRYACVIVNLHVRHTQEGIAKAQHHFRTLYDIALKFGGSFFLTYHRWAQKEQLVAAYPQLGEFFELKRKYDPYEKFTSDWYLACKEMIGL